jgi:hypothetical protein
MQSASVAYRDFVLGITTSTPAFVDASLTQLSAIPFSFIESRTLQLSFLGQVNEHNIRVLLPLSKIICRPSDETLSQHQMRVFESRSLTETRLRANLLLLLGYECSPNG